MSRPSPRVPMRRDYEESMDDGHARPTHTPRHPRTPTTPTPRTPRHSLPQPLAATTSLPNLTFVSPRTYSTSLTMNHDRSNDHDHEYDRRSTSAVFPLSHSPVFTRPNAPRRERSLGGVASAIGALQDYVQSTGDRGRHQQHPGGTHSTTRERGPVDEDAEDGRYTTPIMRPSSSTGRRTPNTAPAAENEPPRTGRRTPQGILRPPSTGRRTPVSSASRLHQLQAEYLADQPQPRLNDRHQAHSPHAHSRDLMDAQAEHERERMVWRDRERDLTARVRRLEELSSAQERDLACLHGDLATRDEALESTKHQLHSTSQELRRTRDSSSQLSLDAARLEKELGAVYAELEGRDKEVEAARREGERLRKEARAWKKEMDMREEEMQTLHLDLDVLQQELSARDAELGRAQSEIAKRDEDLEGLQMDLAAREAELDAAHAELDAAHTALEERDAEISHLERLLRDTSANARSGPSRLTSSPADVPVAVLEEQKKLKRRLQSAKEALRRAEERADVAVDEASRDRAECEEMREVVGGLIERVEREGLAPIKPAVYVATGRLSPMLVPTRLLPNFKQQPTNADSQNQQNTDAGPSSRARRNSIPSSSAHSRTADTDSSPVIPRKRKPRTRTPSPAEGSDHPRPTTSAPSPADAPLLQVHRPVAGGGLHPFGNGAAVVNGTANTPPTVSTMLSPSPTMVHQPLASGVGGRGGGALASPFVLAAPPARVRGAATNGDAVMDVDLDVDGRGGVRGETMIMEEGVRAAEDVIRALDSAVARNKALEDEICGLGDKISTMRASTQGDANEGGEVGGGDEAGREGPNPPTPSRTPEHLLVLGASADGMRVLRTSSSSALNEVRGGSAGSNLRSRDLAPARSSSSSVITRPPDSRRASVTRPPDSRRSSVTRPPESRPRDPPAPPPDSPLSLLASQLSSLEDQIKGMSEERGKWFASGVLSGSSGSGSASSGSGSASSGSGSGSSGRGGGGGGSHGRSGSESSARGRGRSGEREGSKEEEGGNKKKEKTKKKKKAEGAGSGSGSARKRKAVGEEDEDRDREDAAAQRQEQQPEPNRQHRRKQSSSSSLSTNSLGPTNARQTQAQPAPRRGSVSVTTTAPTSATARASAGAAYTDLDMPYAANAALLPTPVSAVAPSGTAAMSMSRLLAASAGAGTGTTTSSSQPVLGGSSQPVLGGQVQEEVQGGGGGGDWEAEYAAYLVEQERVRALEAGAPPPPSAPMARTLPMSTLGGAVAARAGGAVRQEKEAWEVEYEAYLVEQEEQRQQRQQNQQSASANPPPSALERKDEVEHLKREEERKRKALEEEYEAKVEKQRREIEVLRARLMDAASERAGAVEGRVGSVESRVGGVESRVGGVENRVGGVEKGLLDVQGRVGDAQARLADCGGKVERVEERAEVSAQRLDAVAGDVQRVQGAVEDVRKEVQSGLGDARRDMDLVKSGVEKARADVGDVRGEVDRVRGEVGELRKRSEATGPLIEDRVVMLRGDIGVVDQRVGGVQLGVEALRKDVRVGIDGVLVRVSGLEGQAGEVDVRMEELRQELQGARGEGQETRLGLEGVKTQIEGVIGQVEESQKGMGEVKGEIGRVGGKLAVLRTEVEAKEQRLLEGLQAKADKGDLDARLNAVSDTWDQHLKTTTAALESRLQTASADWKSQLASASEEQKVAFAAASQEHRALVDGVSSENKALISAAAEDAKALIATASAEHRGLLDTASSEQKKNLAADRARCVDLVNNTREALRRDIATASKVVTTRLESEIHDLRTEQRESETRLADRIQSTVDEQVDERLSANIAGRVDEIVGARIDERVDDRIGWRMEGVEAEVAGRVAQRFDLLATGTEEQLDRLRGAVVDEFEDVREQLAGARADVAALTTQDLAGARGKLDSLRHKYGELRDEVRAEVDAVRAELGENVDVLRERDEVISDMLHDAEERLDGMMHSLHGRIDNVSGRVYAKVADVETRVGDVEVRMTHAERGAVRGGEKRVQTIESITEELKARIRRIEEECNRLRANEVELRQRFEGMHEQKAEEEEEEHEEQDGVEQEEEEQTKEEEVPVEHFEHSVERPDAVADSKPDATFMVHSGDGDGDGDGDGGDDDNDDHAQPYRGQNHSMPNIAMLNRSEDWTSHSDDPVHNKSLPFFPSKQGSREPSPLEDDSQRVPFTFPAMTSRKNSREEGSGPHSRSQTVTRAFSDMDLETPLMTTLLFEATRLLDVEAPDSSSGTAATEVPQQDPTMHGGETIIEDASEELEEMHVSYEEQDEDGAGEQQDEEDGGEMQPSPLHDDEEYHRHLDRLRPQNDDEGAMRDDQGREVPVPDESASDGEGVREDDNTTGSLHLEPLSRSAGPTSGLGAAMGVDVDTWTYTSRFDTLIAGVDSLARSTNTNPSPILGSYIPLPPSPSPAVDDEGQVDDAPEHDDQDNNDDSEPHEFETHPREDGKSPRTRARLPHRSWHHPGDQSSISLTSIVPESRSVNHHRDSDAGSAPDAAQIDFWAGVGFPGEAITGDEEGPHAEWRPSEQAERAGEQHSRTYSPPNVNIFGRHSRVSGRQKSGDGSRVSIKVGGASSDSDEGRDIRETRSRRRRGQSRSAARSPQQAEQFPRSPSIFNSFDDCSVIQDSVVSDRSVAIQDGSREADVSRRGVSRSRRFRVRDARGSPSPARGRHLAVSEARDRPSRKGGYFRGSESRATTSQGGSTGYDASAGDFSADHHHGSHSSSPPRQIFGLEPQAHSFRPVKESSPMYGADESQTSASHTSNVTVHSPASSSPRGRDSYNAAKQSPQWPLESPERRNEQPSPPATPLEYNPLARTHGIFASPRPLVAAAPSFALRPLGHAHTLNLSTHPLDVSPFRDHGAADTLPLGHFATRPRTPGAADAHDNPLARIPMLSPSPFVLSPMVGPPAPLGRAGSVGAIGLATARLSTGLSRSLVNGIGRAKSTGPSMDSRLRNRSPSPDGMGLVGKIVARNSITPPNNGNAMSTPVRLLSSSAAAGTSGSGFLRPYMPETDSPNPFLVDVDPINRRISGEGAWGEGTVHSLESASMGGELIPRVEDSAGEEEEGGGGDTDVEEQEDQPEEDEEEEEEDYPGVAASYASGSSDREYEQYVPDDDGEYTTSSYDEEDDYELQEEDDEEYDDHPDYEADLAEFERQLELRFNASLQDIPEFDEEDLEEDYVSERSGVQRDPDEHGGQSGSDAHDQGEKCDTNDQNASGNPENIESYDDVYESDSGVHGRLAMTTDDSMPLVSQQSASLDVANVDSERVHEQLVNVDLDDLPDTTMAHAV